MKVKINRVLQERGKTRYWLSKYTGITYQNILKLCNEQYPPKTIKMKTLDKICTALDCKIEDILISEEDSDTLCRLEEYEK